jgi:hypothetical protein
LGEQYQWLSSLLCRFLHYAVTSPLLVPFILLNNLLYRVFGKSLCTWKGVGSDVHERRYRPEPV